MSQPGPLSPEEAIQMREHRRSAAPISEQHVSLPGGGGVGGQHTKVAPNSVVPYMTVSWKFVVTHMHFNGINAFRFEYRNIRKLLFKANQNHEVT